MAIGLVIAEGHGLIRAGLRGVFAASDIDVVGEAATPQQVIRCARLPSVDVLLLALSWRVPYIRADHGIELLRQVRAERPDLPILMYSVYDWISFIDRCRALRANGYLVKGVDDRLLVKAVHAVHGGDNTLWADRRRNWRTVEFTHGPPPD